MAFRIGTQIAGNNINQASDNATVNAPQITSGSISSARDVITADNNSTVNTGPTTIANRDAVNAGGNATLNASHAVASRGDH